MNRTEANKTSADKTATNAVKKTRRLRLPAAAILIIAAAALALRAYAGDSLLTPGTSRITADSTFDFTLNLESLISSDERSEGSDGEFVVALSVSPAVSGMSVKEGKGSVNAVTGEYQVTSSQLGTTTKLHFTVAPSTDITSDTTYTVSVNVTGSVTGSDSFEFIVTPVQSSDGSRDTDGAKDKDADSERGSSAPDKGSKGGKQGGSAKGSGSMSSSGSGSSSVTYAGSWDNYLDSLSVDGYEFTREFNKIRDTYFLRVPESVTSLDVSAVASDSSAVVAIAGNSELSEGRSKIMVNVTADDGSVRVYRIYVDRVSEEEMGAENDREQK